MSTLSYVIISPVRNEAKHLQKTIDSVVAQTLRPSKWVIVDDGSTDGTGELINTAAEKHAWITVIHRKDRGFREQGSGVMAAFYTGFGTVQSDSWDLIVKLDMDLSFEPDYFERLLEEFHSDPRLGVASGVYYEACDGVSWTAVRMPSYHAAGASKVIRRSCFEEIGGFVCAKGWDTVDEIRALTRGWRTRHFPALKMRHWKPEGSAVGQWRTNVMHGEIYYLTGGGALFFMLKVLHRINYPPLFLAGAGMVWGHVRASLRRRRRLVTSEEARCYRQLLNRRITDKLRNLIGWA